MPEPTCAGRRKTLTMKTSIARAIAVTAVWIATAGASGAQDATAANAPVSIVRCTVLDEYPAFAPSDVGSVIPTDTMVQIAFVNRSERTIRDVTFRVDALGGNRTIGYLGRFSSGELTQHTFGPFGDVGYNARCGVESATFDDGTVWNTARALTSRGS